MINAIIRWIVYAALIMFIAWLVPGISISNFGTAMIVAVVIGLINIFIKPVINFISLPVNVLTLGLFAFIINAFLFWLAGYFTPGFSVEGFWSALLGSVLISFFSGILERNKKK